jgi:hypothetical protein
MNKVPFPMDAEEMASRIVSEAIKRALLRMYLIRLRHDKHRAYDYVICSAANIAKAMAYAMCRFNTEDIISVSEYNEENDLDVTLSGRYVKVRNVEL